MGGGTAGAIAALYLANENKKILIIEKNTALGGMYSYGMYRYYMGAEGGFFEKIDAMIDDISHRLPIVDSYGSQPLIRKYIYDQKLKKENVNISFSSVLTGVYVEDNKVLGVQYLSQNNIKNVRSKYFIDASSEAVLCKMAGESVSKGRSCDGLCQPYSNVRVYYDKVNDRIEINNVDSGYIDQDDILEFSKKVILSYNNDIYQKANINEITVGVSPILGVREGSTIEGRDKIRFDKIIMNYEVCEPLYYSKANMDNHTKDMAFESEALCDWIVGLSLWSIKLSIPISKENIIPKELDNVVACGRCIAMDHDVASHTRMMRDCQKSGEVAGIIISECLNRNIMPMDLDYEDVYPKLIKYGCLNSENNIKIEDNPPIGVVDKIKIPKNDTELISQISSDRPGIAMLKAFQEQKINILLDGLNSKDKNYKINSAIVLALLYKDNGLKVLLENALSRDNYLPKTSKSYNILRGITSIYALGKIGDLNTANKLLKMLENNQSFINDNIKYDKFIGHREDYRFQYISHLIRSILNIAERFNNKLLQKEIVHIIQDSKFHVFCTLKSNPNELYEMTHVIKKYVHWKITKGGMEYDR